MNLLKEFCGRKNDFAALPHPAPTWLLLSHPKLAASQL
jgi:hypothetical protein